MPLLTGLFRWLFKGFVFFTLFAFSLNNGHDVTLNFFFGRHWTGPLVLVVLATFVLGVVIGVLGMAPRWWRMRRAAQRRTDAATPASSTQATPSTTATATGADGAVTGSVTGTVADAAIAAENLRRTELGLPLIDDGLSNRHHHGT